MNVWTILGREEFTFVEEGMGGKRQGEVVVVEEGKKRKNKEGKGGIGLRDARVVWVGHPSRSLATHGISALLLFLLLLLRFWCSLLLSSSESSLQSLCLLESSRLLVSPPDPSTLPLLFSLGSDVLCFSVVHRPSVSPCLSVGESSSLIFCWPLHGGGEPLARNSANARVSFPNVMTVSGVFFCNRDQEAPFFPVPEEAEGIPSEVSKSCNECELINRMSMDEFSRCDSLRHFLYLQSCTWAADEILLFDQLLEAQLQKIFRLLMKYSEDLQHQKANQLIEQKRIIIRMGQCCSGPLGQEGKPEEEAMSLRKRCLALAKEQRTRLYILKRCIIMLLQWPKYDKSSLF
ncbi:hypothetical protein M9H77_25570 [Catharanthus roseus]|uniref:Uncharacterized protein n=1 Tax=Catharanthus roseus TaxID=4058 RepID=A0ACC0A9Y1_CATRO|nr:hypothetical protein M9H77_25570 [Catharanthus roseus]